MKTQVLMLIAAVSLAGCAGSGAGYVPVVDGPQQANFSADLNQCQALAQNQPLLDANKKTEIAAAAALMGLLAGLDDDADGDRLGTAVGGAIVGGGLGAAGGAFEGNADRSDVVRNCMSGRGHKVVG